MLVARVLLPKKLCDMVAWKLPWIATLAHLPYSILVAYSTVIKSGTSFLTPRDYPHTYPKKMTTRGQMNRQPAQLCVYCHQKPKFSNHQFCSKTCATQAGGANNNKCIQCHKKPKFKNFDFCGKTCATQAPQRHNALSGAQRGGGNKVPTAKKPSQPAFNTMQPAQMNVQRVPQVDAFLLVGVNSDASVPEIPAPLPQQWHAAPQLQQFPVVPVPQSSASFAPQNNPFQSQSRQQQHQALNQPPLPAMNNTLSPFSRSPADTQQLSANPQPAANDAKCLIPGCGKTVHMDAKGFKTSDYCSKSHREEAVASGIEDACIMCLTYPQSQAGYFCSRTCREAAMDKLPK